MRPDDVNTLASGLIDRVRHFCKYKHMGCKEKAYLNKLSTHETMCNYKTIRCPKSNCRKEVELVKYHEHAKNSFCCGNAVTSGMGGLVKLQSRSPPVDTVTVASKFRVISLTDKTPFNRNIGLTWKLRYFTKGGDIFYVATDYFEKSSLFAVFVTTLPKKDNPFILHQAKMSIKDENNPHQDICMIRDVIPLDKAPSSEAEVLSEDRCWFVPKRTLDALFNIRVGTDGLYHMSITVAVDIL